VVIDGEAAVRPSPDDTLMFRHQKPRETILPSLTEHFPHPIAVIGMAFGLFIDVRIVL
jgi:hypothetical protein